MINCLHSNKLEEEIMLFTSPTFLFLFLPFSILIYFALPKKIQNIFLLLISLFFYAWGEGFYVGLLLLIIFLNYIFGLLINKSRIFLFLGVTTNLLILFYFKYFVFFAGIFISRLGFFHFNLQIPEKTYLPLGISFITFHAISYLADVYGKKITAEKNILNFSLYISLFPHLIAGPIVRYFSIGGQIKIRQTSFESVSYGIQRFIIGLSKKVLLANNLSLVSDRIFAIFPHQLSTEVLWLGLICFSLQIYFDFSGYSDMAIGLARIFGFTFAENFNYPYISNSVQDFWRRWHMTLSSWFRDYLYIPLGGSKKGNFRTYFNILVVFALTGLWHGANYGFLFWGIYYAFFLIIERIFLQKLLLKIWSPLKYIYTLLVVITGWLFFRIENLSYALFLFKMLFGFGQVQNPVYKLDIFLNNELLILIAIGLAASTPVFEILFRKLNKNSSLAFVRVFVLFLLLFLSITQLSSQTYQPFIYFRF